MTFELPDLPYDYDALEPHIDALTMEIHHTKHHNAYTNNLNAAIKVNGLEGKSIEQLLADHNDIAAIRNNGGGWWNHCFFWESMTPGGAEPQGRIAEKIEESMGGMESLKQQFQDAAMSRFGSGWAWLCIWPNDGDLTIYTTPNQDGPLMPEYAGHPTPLLGIDVWEHAYYKKYGPGRATYIEAWWNVVDWNEVSRRYSNCL